MISAAARSPLCSAPCTVAGLLSTTVASPAKCSGPSGRASAARWPCAPSGGALRPPDGDRLVGGEKGHLGVPERLGEAQQQLHGRAHRQRRDRVLLLLG